MLASGATSPPPRLGGWITVSDSLAQVWPVADTFRYPVGDPNEFGLPSKPGGRSFTVLRGVSAGHDTIPPHQGADLGCGVGGDTVREAAAGIVVNGRGTWQAGYGYYVTLAHHLADGTLIYTVYAHLRKGSVRPRAATVIRAGAPVGRVGRTGRATAPHLHFEVRRPSDPYDRWENAEVESPLDFVRRHLHARSRSGTPGP